MKNVLFLDRRNYPVRYEYRYLGLHLDEERGVPTPPRHHHQRGEAEGPDREVNINNNHHGGMGIRVGRFSRFSV